MSSWDFIRITFPKAAKPHRCVECKADIAPGEVHSRTSGKCEGYIESYRLCMYCHRLAQAYCQAFDADEGFPLGCVRQTLAEEGIGDVDAWLEKVEADAAASRALQQRRAHQSVCTQRVLDDFKLERIRQVEVEGWAPEHDDGHSNGEMALAAACYAAPAAVSWGVWPGRMQQGLRWPWDQSWWKPKDRRRDLVRAGALIVAEIERLDRAAG